MKKWIKSLIFVIAIAVVIGVVLSFTVFNKFFNKSEINNTGIIAGNVVSAQITINPGNLPVFLQTLDIVKDIPNNGVILLKTYNYANGKRNIIDTYVITKNIVKKEDLNKGDIIIYLDSKYISKLSDFCNTLKIAKKNNELGFESNMNEALFIWKYKSLLKYKDCFGI